MNVLLEVLLCFFALCGILYFLRDAYRLLSGHKNRQAFYLLIDIHKVPDEISARRAFLELSRLLSRPEAKYMVRGLYVVGASPQQMVFLYEAAADYDINLECVDGGNLVTRLVFED